MSYAGEGLSIVLGMRAASDTPYSWWHFQMDKHFQGGMWAVGASEQVLSPRPETQSHCVGLASLSSWAFFDCNDQLLGAPEYPKNVL